MQGGMYKIASFNSQLNSVNLKKSILPPPLKVNLSYFVVEIVMQNIKEQVLVAYTQIIILWSPYVGNTFTTAHKDEIDNFRGHRNRLNSLPVRLRKMVKYHF